MLCDSRLPSFQARITKHNVQSQTMTYCRLCIKKVESLNILKILTPIIVVCCCLYTIVVFQDFFYDLPRFKLQYHNL